MSSKFSQIPLVSMETDRVTLEKNGIIIVFSTGFDQNLFILAGNNVIDESLDEFKIWQDSTTDYGFSCPLVYEKNPIDL